MAIWILRPIRSAAKALAAHDSPRQIAWGLALGMLLGIVPKGNLLAVAIAMLVFSTRANKPAALLAATIFMWIGWLFDPLWHQVGFVLLSSPTLTPLWTWLYNRPIAPWTSFNNTVVLGSFVSGLALIYPTYRAVLPGVNWLLPRLRQRLQRYRITKLLLGLEVAAGQGNAA